MNSVRALLSKIKPAQAKAFIQSSVGQKVVGGIVIASSVCSFVAHLAPHSWLKDKYIEVLAFYEHGEQKEVSRQLLQIAQQTVNDCHLHDSKKESIGFFHTSVFDTITAGSTGLNWGADIGLPINYTYKSTDDIPIDKMVLFNKETIDWDSMAGEALKNSFILSDSAKKAAIANQIYYNDNQRHIIRGLLSSLVIISVYSTNREFNTKLAMHLHPRSLRLLMYSLVTLVGVAIYFMLTDNINLYYQRSGDKDVVALGEEYIKGSIEYYSKIIQRNRALWELFGRDAERAVTAQGNDAALLRNKHIPHSARLDFFKQALDNLEKKKAEEEGKSQ